MIYTSLLSKLNSNVSLTSGLPMVRQVLRSLQNGRASLLQSPPPSPKKPESRKAGKPKSRKAETRKAGRWPERAEKPGLGQADPTKPRVLLPHITGMPRSLAACHDIEAMWRKEHGATWRQEHLVFSPHYFPVKASRLPNPPTIPL
jgi:hypothetical protein